MRTLRSTLLLHRMPGGSHYDWLFESPPPEGGRDKAARLVCFRVPLDSRAWGCVQRWTMRQLPPHRRIYLDYQGSISGGRGQVRRIDRGIVLPRLWAAGRAVLDVRMRQFEGRVRLRRLTGDRWIAATDPLVQRD